VAGHDPAADNTRPVLVAPFMNALREIPFPGKSMFDSVLLIDTYRNHTYAAGEGLASPFLAPLSWVNAG